MFRPKVVCLPESLPTKPFHIYTFIAAMWHISADNTLMHLVADSSLLIIFN